MSCRTLVALGVVASLLAAAPSPHAADALPWSDSEGTGAPTIVLIHGAGSDRSAWDFVAPLLSRGHRVVRVELPGHGASPALERVSVKEVARAVDRALERQKVERAVLVGHSYGAWVALEAALARPKRAAAVVALDTGTFAPADTARVANLERHLKERYYSLVRVIFETMSEDPVESDSAVALAMRVSPEVLSGYLRDAWRTDLRPRIRALKTPVTVITGAATWPAAAPWTEAKTQLGYETAGDVHGYRLARASHLLMRDQPDSLAVLIERVASSVRPPGTR
jgi:pimeloyl-ACP methyl ester carboxylesterase